MFKKRRGIRLSYNRQGLIYFICMNIRDMPEEVQQKVKELCAEVGGCDSEALYEVITNDRQSIVGISLKYYISEKKLYRMRKEFYEAWKMSDN